MAISGLPSYARRTASGMGGSLPDCPKLSVTIPAAGTRLAKRVPLQAVDLFRSIWCYTVGETLVRARSAGRSPPDGYRADGARGQLPNGNRLAARLERSVETRGGATSVQGA